jgi:hypothetical protein
MSAWSAAGILFAGDEDAGVKEWNVVTSELQSTLIVPTQDEGPVKVKVGSHQTSQTKLSLDGDGV